LRINSLNNNEPHWFARCISGRPSFLLCARTRTWSLWCPMSAKNQLLHFTIWHFEDHIHFIKITTLFLKITGLSVENTTYFLKTNFWRSTFDTQPQSNVFVVRGLILSWFSAKIISVWVTKLFIYSVFYFPYPFCKFKNMNYSYTVQCTWHVLIVNYDLWLGVGGSYFTFDQVRLQNTPPFSNITQ
jgi:hypothetical protein